MPGLGLKKRRRKKKRKEIILTPEEKFNKLLNLRKATRCIRDVNEEYKIWVKLAKDFHEFGISEEAAEVEGAEECETLSLECQEKAKELEPHLSADADKDDRTVTTTMKKKEAEELLNKGKRKTKGRIITFIVLGLFALLIIAYQITPTRYWFTGLEKAVGMDQLAMEGYHKLGDYRDSREKMKEACYDYAGSLSDNGQHNMARAQYAKLAAEGYKDSADQKLREEKIILSHSKAKDIVHYGTCRWLVLENDETSGNVLLAKYRGVHKQPYHEKNEEVTWEKCSLRGFLNDEFLNDCFSEQERANIVTSLVSAEANKTYGTDGGRDTEDKLFLPGAGEVEKYKNVFRSSRNNMRLRVPGENKKTTAFTSYRGKVVDYGFPVAETGVLVRPLMRVDTNIK